LMIILSLIFLNHEIIDEGNWLIAFIPFIQ
jgi:hypothetical protein